MTHFTELIAKRQLRVLPTFSAIANTYIATPGTTVWVNPVYTPQILT